MLISRDSIATFCIAAALAGSNATAQEASILSIKAASEQVHPFFCETDTGKSRLFIIAPDSVENGGNLILYPDGAPVREKKGVYTADFNDGSASISEEEFVSLTSDGAEIGKCKPFKVEILAFLEAVIGANPSALSALADQAYLNDYRWRSLLAQNNAERLEKQLADNPKDRTADEQKIARLNRENDDLKLKLCALDAGLKFSVCKPATP